MVPITVIGAKYDIFAQQNEPIQKKLLCTALRYLCHTNGADLVFASIKEQNPLRLYKNMVGWHTFKRFAALDKMLGGGDDQNQPGEEQTNGNTSAETPKNQYNKIPPPEKNHEHALSIYAGYDNLLKIGEPQGASTRQNVPIDQLWQQ